MMEEYGLVLGYLPLGKPNAIQREPIAYIIGKKFFTLLEAVIKKDLKLKSEDELYIGKDLEKREKIDRIKDRVTYEELTTSAKSEIKEVIKKIIISRENEFVNFFNRCGPISIRQHQLELLPNIGKKHLTDILNEREKKKFESFKDISERMEHFHDPVDILTERVIEELKGSRYYLFTRPPSQKPKFEGFEKKRYFRERKRRW